MNEEQEVQILKLMLIEQKAGNFTEVEKLKALLQGGAVNQAAQPQAVPGVDQAIPPVDQAVPIDQAAQVYDDVPSVPEVPASMDTQPIAPNPEINPADNLADQTTNNRAWLGKITDALWPGSQGMSVGDYLSTAGGRHATPFDAMADAKIWPTTTTPSPLQVRTAEGEPTVLPDVSNPLFPRLPEGFDLKGLLTSKVSPTGAQAQNTGGLTIPDILQQRVNRETNKFEFADEIPTFDEWKQIVLSDDFLPNVGTIGGPMLYQKFKNDQARFRATPPSRGKDVALMAIISGLATMFSGSVSDILNQTPAELGRFDLSSLKKAAFPDLKTHAGRFQQGSLWTAVPEMAFAGAAEYAVKPAARWALQLKKKWMDNVYRQMEAARDISTTTPGNIESMAEWQAMPWWQQGLPDWMGGPKAMEVGPYGRQLAGEVATEPYVVAGGVIPRASMAFGAFPGAGAAIRKTAVHQSKTAIENMRSKLDLMGKDIETDSLGNLVTYAAQRWGRDQVKQVDKLYKHVNELARATPGGASYVPTSRMKNATQEIYDDVITNFPKDSVTGEPIALYSTIKADAQKWLTEIARIGDTATLAEVRGLRAMVSDDLAQVGKGEYAGLTKKALKNFKDSMTDAIHIDAVAALKAQGVPEAKAVANALQLANTTYKTFKDFTRTEAGQQFNLVDQSFWKKAHLEGRLIQDGGVTADKMFGLAFNTGHMSPQYLRDMKAIMGDKAFDTAAANYLGKAMDEAFDVGKLAAPTGLIERFLSQPGYQMGTLEGMQTPAKFNEASFRQTLGLGRGGPFKGKGSGSLRELLKLTGNKVTLKNVDSLMTVLARYPVNMDLAQMAARRIPLAGTKGALGVVTGGISRGVGTAGGAAFMGTAGSAIATMLVLNQMGRLLSNPNALKSLVRLGDTMSAAEKSGRTIGRHSQKVMWVKLFTDLGYDKTESGSAFESLWGEGVEVYKDLDAEARYRLMQGRQVLESVTGG
jgi:hypothetical protein